MTGYELSGFSFQLQLSVLSLQFTVSVPARAFRFPIPDCRLQLRLPADERVLLPLLSDGRIGAVAAHDRCVVRERVETLADRIEDLLSVAAPKVGAADRAAEERVPGVQDRRVGVEEKAARAGCVAGRVNDAQGGLSERDRLAVRESGVGVPRSLRLQAEHRRLRGK